MIEMRDVAFAYPRGGALFQGLTLSLPRGSFHFLTGPSGAGKTTFLRMCIADLLPTAGKLTLFGQDAATMGRDAIAGLRRRVGLVHQDTQFLDHLPVAENIALPMMVAGEPIDMDAIRDLLAWVQMTAFGSELRQLSRDGIADLRRRVGVVHQDTQFLDHLPVAENIALPLMVAGHQIDMAALGDLLAWVQLGGHARAMPPELSGGERQRAALARAVIMSPDLIVADEPTGNLDWDMSMRLLQLLIELNRSGKAVLIATHDLNLIRAAKQQVQARVLRIAGKRLQLAGADL